ncbi:MAG: 2Fe-2S iron-sulfur cluster-binding protein [Candidatus Marinimicrobia bacterium]|nr:2Fe-2S iron-sulfur cluster-binding protein [Candidatus Neomarinimicrobiota bacterium]
MKKISIDVHINGSRHSLTSEAGAGLPEILRKNHISFATPCGGYGTCGKCKVRFLTSAPASGARGYQSSSLTKS